MLYDQIVRLAGTGRGFNVIQPFVSKPGVDRVHYSNLLIHDHVRIIGHAVLDCILAFEQIYFVVVHAGVSNIV